MGLMKLREARVILPTGWTDQTGVGRTGPASASVEISTLPWFSTTPSHGTRIPAELPHKASPHHPLQRQPLPLTRIPTVRSHTPAPCSPTHTSPVLSHTHQHPDPSCVVGEREIEQPLSTKPSASTRILSLSLSIYLVFTPRWGLKRVGKELVFSPPWGLKRVGKEQTGWRE